ncbi:MAG TPA: PaaI family thioesterase [Deltaproteobacteria bacterium]|nr:PaaI family thioesterase [Deltaproteobacteria bacterium]
MGKGLEQKVPPATGPHRFEMNQWISCAPFERLLNMTIVEACDGRATLTMPFLMDYAQSAGLMHGGALVTLADTAVAKAIKSIIAPLSHFVTTELESRFLLSVTKGIVTAKAEVVSREGRRIKGKATLYDEEGRAVMEFCSTFKVSKDTKIK